MIRMYNHEIHAQLRRLNWRIHFLLNHTREEQLSLEIRERMAELSVALCRALPMPWEEVDE